MSRVVDSWNVVLAIATLALTSCSGSGSVGEVRTGRSDLSQRELFERKVQCEKYAPQITQEFRDQERELYQKQHLKSEDLVPEIERLFYSPHRNSCVCVIHDKFFVPSDKSFIQSVYVFDVLTKEGLWSKEYFSPEEAQNIDKDVKAQVGQLGGQ